MYGPYIKYGKKNYKIPKSWKDATDLTMEDCIAIIGKDIKEVEKSKVEKVGKWKSRKIAKK
jgi:DNA topoisomerase-1